MIKRNGAGVQRHTLKLFIFESVFDVADHWMAQFREMNPDLIFAARQQVDLQFAEQFILASHFILRFRPFALGLTG